MILSLGHVFMLSLPSFFITDTVNVIEPCKLYGTGGRDLIEKCFLIQAPFRWPSSTSYLVYWSDSKRSSYCCASSFVIGDKICSNLFLNLQEMCWHAFDYSMSKID